MKINKFAALATTLTVISLATLCPRKAQGQELSAQVVGGSYKNASESMVGVGFAAKKPILDSAANAGIDLTLAISKDPNPVEACQFWFSFKPFENVTLNPYIYKDRFYGVDPYGVGMVASIGGFNLIAEYEAPKVRSDPGAWAEAVNYSFRLGKLDLGPKLIFAQIGNHWVDLLGFECRFSYDIGSNIAPFFKFKTMDMLQTSQFTTNVQAGVGIKF